MIQSIEDGAGNPAGTRPKAVWTLRSKRCLQAELKRRGVTYAELARRLTEMGVPESEGSVTVKINRGTFPVWFFLAALHAIGRRRIRIDDVVSGS